MKKYLLFVLLFISFFYIKAQNGKLLLIGGGYENISSTSSWNYEAFNWVIDQSTNKKVAFLHYSSTTSSDFENYFKTYCGASEVKSFVVNSSNANNASLINEISEYDVFYFRGGDQSNYYNYWKGKLIEDAIHEKFNSGGVICGTSAGLAILSGVLYSAETNTAYSDVCIKNTDQVSITLKNDFIEVMPGFIFDSHFTERGRMGRLISFMAHWKKNNGEDISGIGIDEITALAITADGNATAYGAGTVNIYRLKNGNDFKSGTMLNVDSMEVSQLTHGKTINLNDYTIGGFSNLVEPDDIIETCPSKIYASGIENLGYANVALLEEFLDDGNTNDPIIIFSDKETGIASSFKDKLTDLGADNIKIYETNNLTASDEAIANDIESTSKYVFIGNNRYNFFNGFLKSDGVAGNELNDAFKNRKLILAFIGDNARFCGSVVIGNYLGKEANATIYDGLNLLKTTVIIPKTFKRGSNGVTDLWHASHASLPYAMVKENIKNGVWLNVENYLIFQGDQNKAKITIKGTSPAMILTQNNTKGEMVSQTYSGTGNPSKKAGFDKMNLSFVKNEQSYILADYESTLTSISNIQESAYIKLYPNPATTEISIHSEKDIQLVCIYDILGNLKFRENYIYKEAIIDIQKLNLLQGVYMVEVRTWDDERYIRKFIIK